MNPNTFQPIGSAAARVVHYLSPRRNRDLERGRRAADAARRAPGASAMATALAQIDATFDDAAVINALKMRVERFMGLGADHPAVRARYGALSEMIRERSAAWEQANSLAAGPLGFSPHPDTALTIAINLVERWYSRHLQRYRQRARRVVSSTANSNLDNSCKSRNRVQSWPRQIPFEASANIDSRRR